MLEEEEKDDDGVNCIVGVAVKTVPGRTIMYGVLRDGQDALDSDNAGRGRRMK